jgi:biotin carboxyl carrier protein
MKFWVRVESHEKRVDIDGDNGSYRIEIDGKPIIVDCRHFGHKDYLSLLIDNKSYLIESAPVKSEEGTYYAQIYGRHYNLEVLDERLAAVREARRSGPESGSYFISSPMPGLIVDVRVKPGDHVTAGTAVVIMEAMKMQNERVTEVDGVVKAVNIRPKETVDSQAPLIEIERSR